MHCERRGTALSLNSRRHQSLTISCADLNLLNLPHRRELAGSRRFVNRLSVIERYDTPVPEAAAGSGISVIPRDVVALNAPERVNSLTLF
jgi:hypothetical protein